MTLFIANAQRRAAASMACNNFAKPCATAAAVCRCSCRASQSAVCIRTAAVAACARRAFTNCVGFVGGISLGGGSVCGMRHQIRQYTPGITPLCLLHTRCHRHQTAARTNTQHHTAHPKKNPFSLFVSQVCTQRMCAMCRVQTRTSMHVAYIEICM